MVLHHSRGKSVERRERLRRLGRPTSCHQSNERAKSVFLVSIVCCSSFSVYLHSDIYHACVILILFRTLVACSVFVHVPPKMEPIFNIRSSWNLSVLTHDNEIVIMRLTSKEAHALKCFWWQQFYHNYLFPGWRAVVLVSSQFSYKPRYRIQCNAAD